MKTHIISILSLSLFGLSQIYAEDSIDAIQIGANTYKNVVVEDYDSSTGYVKIKHATGVSKLAGEKLTEDQKEVLGVTDLPDTEVLLANRANAAKEEQLKKQFALEQARAERERIAEAHAALERRTAELNKQKEKQSTSTTKNHASKASAFSNPKSSAFNDSGFFGKTTIKINKNKKKGKKKK